MNEADARDELVHVAGELDRLGLNRNSSGNLSTRLPDGRILVTPSGVPADRLTAAAMVALDVDGIVVGSDTTVPTSEWRLHTELYRRRPDVAAVVHTHSPHATALACHGCAVPPVHYVVARFGTADLRCAPYAIYGSAELADHVAETLGPDGVACLMANHGAIAASTSLDRALSLAIDIEWFSQVYLASLAAGQPTALNANQMADVAAKFATYGQPPTGERSAPVTSRTASGS